MSEGEKRGGILVRFMMCLPRWKQVPCDAMNKEGDGKCLFAGRDSSRLRSRASMSSSFLHVNLEDKEIILIDKNRRQAMC